MANNEIKNIEKHNIARLEVITEKIEAVQNVVEGKARVLENKKTNFINKNIASIINELENFNIPKVEINNDKLNYIDMDNFFKYPEFNFENKKLKSPFFKNLFLSLFFASFFTFFFYILEAVKIGILSMNNFSIHSITALFEKGTLESIIGDLSLLVTNVSGEYVFGVFFSFLFLSSISILFSISSSKKKKNQEKIYNDLKLYDNIIKNEISSYLEVSDFMDKLLKSFDLYDVLLSEEETRLKRINFLKKDDEKLDLQTVRDISRISKFVEHIIEILELPIIKDEVLNPELVFELNDSDTFVQNHLKKRENI